MQKPLILSAAALVLTLGVAQAQDTTMSFFITSVGLGKGANLGGLDGADAHCAALAEAKTPGQRQGFVSSLKARKAPSGC